MDKKRRNFALGALIAAGAGYLAGILTAPKSGKETRQDIQEVGQRATTEAERRLKSLYSDLSINIDDMTARLGDMKLKTKVDVKNLLKKANHTKQKTREILSAFHEGTADDKDLAKAIKDINEAIDRLKIFMKKDAKV